MLARAWSRFKEPADLTAAQQALGIFETAPPQGVRVQTAAGAMYAEYTYAPSDRILNGFIQALVGLHDYTSITKDPLGLSLFEAGDAEARAIVPLYNTGAWSMYDQFGESDLNYHELLAEFLQHLCERTSKGEPLGTASAQIPGDQIYCTTAQSFTADLHTPPTISLISKKLAGGTRAGVQMSLSKISTVSMTVRQGSKVVWSNSATVERGKPRLLWITPSKGGTFAVELTATDLAATSHRERHGARQPSLASAATPRLGPSAFHGHDPFERRSAMTRLADAWRELLPAQRRAALASGGLFVSMLLPWYDKTDTVVVHGAAKATQTSLSAFQAFSFVEAAVLLVSAGLLAMLFARAERRSFQLPGGDGLIVMIAGGWTALLIFYRLLDKPELQGNEQVTSTVGVEWGIFIALLLALGLVIAGGRMRAEERPEPPLRRARGTRPRLPLEPTHPPIPTWAGSLRSGPLLTSRRPS